jgi:hypothetical protein
MYAQGPSPAGAPAAVLSGHVLRHLSHTHYCVLHVQGFVEAKMLAKKFASLYFLLEDLLSPQKHYDWGLRAIKSVLVVAGSLLRAEEGQVESNVLFRALRDFNVPKILAQVCDANDNSLPSSTC